MIPKKVEGSSRIKDRGTEKELRDPQPSTWNKLIKERDGEESGAKVEMFRHSGDGLVQLTRKFESARSSKGLVHPVGTMQERLQPSAA